MADIVTPEKRSKMMSGIKNKDTKPELLIRKSLHKKGFRYKLHDKNLPGKPDLVLPKYKAVIFINGCFWHKHDCYLFKWPKSRCVFWKQKIEGNAKKDLEHFQSLEQLGWRIMIIWECSIKGKKLLQQDNIIEMTVKWLKSDIPKYEISGETNL